MNQQIIQDDLSNTGDSTSHSYRETGERGGSVSGLDATGTMVSRDNNDAEIGKKKKPFAQFTTG